MVLLLQPEAGNAVVAFSKHVLCHDGLDGELLDSDDDDEDAFGQFETDSDFNDNAKAVDLDAKGT